jgi:hypothetical protein
MPTSALSFEIVDWLPPLAGEPPEVADTAALLRIEVGGHFATQAEDALSRSLRNAIRGSAYPVALWLAANWWRLRWEPPPSGNRKPSLDWRMSHLLPAAGHGFLWPELEFASDGAEGMELTCRASPPGTRETLRFLSRFRRRISASDFERAAVTFIEQVVGRLRETGHAASPLSELWVSLKAERADRALSQLRRLEAMAGFDPEEAPADVTCGLRGVAGKAGEEAAAEVASALGSVPGFTAAIGQLHQLADRPGLKAGMPAAAEVSALLRAPAVRTGRTHPAALGERVARTARATWGLGDDPVSDERLADLLGIPAAGLRPVPNGATPPVGLGVRKERAGAGAELHLRGRMRQDRRFEAGRLLCDQAATPPGEAWLLATTGSTARQQVQRAFSAELLAPIGALLERLGADRSDEAMAMVAEQFDVAPLVVRSQLANHGELPRAGV